MSRLPLPIEKSCRTERFRDGLLQLRDAARIRSQERVRPHRLERKPCQIPLASVDDDAVPQRPLRATCRGKTRLPHTLRLDELEPLETGTGGRPFVDRTDLAHSLDEGIEHRRRDDRRQLGRRVDRHLAGRPDEPLPGRVVPPENGDRLALPLELHRVAGGLRTVLLHECQGAVGRDLVTGGDAVDQSGLREISDALELRLAEDAGGGELDRERQLPARHVNVDREAEGAG
nr:hypothetical protein [uncultured Aureimonas sp.]